MPDYYAHIMFALDGCEQLEKNVSIDALKLGALFADFTLYKTMPKDRKRAKHIAYLLHEENTTLFYTHLVNAVKKHYSLDTYAFLLGALSHYSLDVHVNPYIIYHSNNDLNERLAFIKNIDLTLMKDTFNKAPKKITMRDILPSNKRLPYALKTLAEDALYHTYDEASTGKLLSRSYQNMRFLVLNVFQDKTGLKYKVFKNLDRLKKSDFMLSSLINSKPLDQKDYLNLNQRPWHHPVTKIVSHESVPALFEAAHLFFAEMVEQVDRYLFHDEAIDFDACFKNQSLNTGVSLESDQTVRMTINQVKNESNL